MNNKSIKMLNDFYHKENNFAFSKGMGRKCLQARLMDSKEKDLLVPSLPTGKVISHLSFVSGNMEPII